MIISEEWQVEFTANADVCIEKADGEGILNISIPIFSTVHINSLCPIQCSGPAWCSPYGAVFWICD